MKRVLVLYPGLVESRAAILRPHRWRLRLGGIRLTLADEEVVAGDAAAFHGVLELPAPEDAAAAWDALAAYLDRVPHDAIVAQSEPSLLLGARAAREFGLKGPSVAAAAATVIKPRTRAILHEAGVAQPQFTLARSAADVRRFGERVGWPVVIKGVASSRQRLVIRVRGSGDADEAVTQLCARMGTARDVRRLVAFTALEELDLGCDPFRDFLVESFAPGIPVECDGVVDGDRVHSFGVCEQIPSAQSEFFIDGYVLPARLAATARNELEQQTQRALRAIGFRNSGYSVEYRHEGSKARLIEINGRLGWDEGLSELHEEVCGALPAVVALRLALGKRIAALRPRRHAALRYSSCLAGGVVERVPSAAELRAISSRQVSCEVHPDRGATLLPAEHPDSRPHVAHVLATDRDSSDRALGRAEAALTKIDVRVRSVDAVASPTSLSVAAAATASQRSAPLGH